MQRTPVTRQSPFPWDDVRLFLCLYRSRTMGDAARALGINTSTVSRRLATLEESLDAALFDRGRDGLRPVQAAHDLLATAELVEHGVAQFASTAEGFERTVSGEVRLTCPPNLADVLVIPLVRKLREDHPELMVTLLPSRDAADLDRREADIAIRTVRPRRGDLVVRRVMGITWTPAAHPEFLPASPGSLPWIGWCTPPPHLGRWCEAQGIEPVLRTDSLTTQIAAATARLGVALLPGPALPHYGLVPVPGFPPGPDDALFLATPRTLRHIPRIRVLWDALVATLT